MVYDVYFWRTFLYVRQISFQKNFSLTFFFLSLHIIIKNVTGRHGQSTIQSILYCVMCMRGNGKREKL